MKDYVLNEGTGWVAVRRIDGGETMGELRMWYGLRANLIWESHIGPHTSRIANTGPLHYTVTHPISIWCSEGVRAELFGEEGGRGFSLSLPSGVRTWL